MSDTGFAFINELKAQGYDTSTVEQLVRMANHGVRLEYLQGLKSLGYSVKTTDLVVRMKDHGVSLNFIRELTGTRLYRSHSPKNWSERKITALPPSSSTNSSPPVIPALTRRLDQLRDHGVSTSFITELKELGYERLPLEELAPYERSRRQRDFHQGAEGSRLQQSSPIEQLVRLKDHGVSASYIRRMKEQGL